MAIYHDTKLNDVQRMHINNCCEQQTFNELV